jgi:hypothetical protein
MVDGYGNGFNPIVIFHYFAANLKSFSSLFRQGKPGRYNGSSRKIYIFKGKTP